MKTYVFRQNNSGGFFIGPINREIKASNANEANEIAVKRGIYFDGVHKGIDCACCGDRWTQAFDEPISDFTKEQAEALVSVINGLIKAFGSEHVTLEDVRNAATERLNE